MKKYLSVVLLIAACCDLVCAQQESDCALILTTGLRNFSSQDSSFEYEHTVYDNYCDADGNFKSSSSGGGLGVIIGSIPIGGNFDSNDVQGRFRKFCRDFHDNFIVKGVTHSSSSTIASGAYQAFMECKRLETNGIQVHYTNNGLSLANFYFKSFEHPIDLVGVVTTPNITCKGQDPQGTLIAYDPSTKISGAQTLSIACERTPSLTGTGTNTSKLYDEGHIIIQTKAGSFTAALPRDTEWGPDQASEFLKDLADLRRDHDELVRKWSGTNDLVWEATRGSRYTLARGKDCPPDRWVNLGEIQIAANPDDQAWKDHPNERFELGGSPTKATGNWDWVKARLCWQNR